VPSCKDVAVKTKGNAAQNNVLFGSIEALAAVQPLLNDQLQKYNQIPGQPAQQRRCCSASGQHLQPDHQQRHRCELATPSAICSPAATSPVIGDAFVEIAETINSISLTPAEQQLSGITTAIELVTSEIQRQKEYGLDTTNAENRLKQLEQARQRGASSHRRANPR